MPKLDWKRATYGAELEFADIDTRKKLPKFAEWNRKEYMLCNSNGSANDPLRKLNRYGGEINLAPSNSIREMLSKTEELYAMFPEMRFNFRCGLHVHIRVPGLRENLVALQRLTRYYHKNAGKILRLIEGHIPEPTPDSIANPTEFSGAVKWHHHLTEEYHKRQHREHTLEKLLNARSVKEFHQANFPFSKKTGKPQYHFVRRAGINLAHLWRPSETVEFRLFFMSKNLDRMYNAFLGSERLLFYGAEYNGSVEKALEDGKYPKLIPYNHLLYTLSAMTNVNSLGRAKAEENYRNLIAMGIYTKRELGWEE